MISLRDRSQGEDRRMKAPACADDDRDSAEVDAFDEASNSFQAQRAFVSLSCTAGPSRAPARTTGRTSSSPLTRIAVGARCRWDREAGTAVRLARLAECDVLGLLHASYPGVGSRSSRIFQNRRSSPAPTVSRIALRASRGLARETAMPGEFLVLAEET